MTRRPLTSEEIREILTTIEPVTVFNPEITTNVYEQRIAPLRKQLASVTVYDDDMLIIAKLKKHIYTAYVQSQVSAGESMGILTAQSIGERQTQLTLNTFHSTGATVGTVVTGVPRFKELLNASKNPKNSVTTVILKKPTPTIQSVREGVGSHLVFLSVKNVCVKFGKWTFSTAVALPKWYAAFQLMHPDLELPLANGVVVPLTVNTEVLFEYKLTLREVAESIKEAYSDVDVVYGPHVSETIHIWVKLSVIESAALADLSRDEKVDLFVTDVLVPSIKSARVCGVGGIHAMHFVKQEDSQWIVQTTGYNLKEIFALPMVDELRTSSNHMWEIFQTLGLEAVREFLVQEFVNIISIDSYINIRHIELLVDVMLYTGNISPISRYGVHRNQSGPLTKSSFEESLDQFLKAGIFADVEQTNGVSAAIMCGKVSRIGTGICDLVYQSPGEPA